MRILIIGRNGQIGWELQGALAPVGDVVALDRSQLDLTDLATVASTIRRIAPHVIVNAAAYTDVDSAESEEGLARTVNALAPAAMAESARRLGALFVHYSSDYVFDGSSDHPYTESDPVCPLSAYGRSKAEGEHLIREVGGRSLILRTAWIYSDRKHNFLLAMLRLAQGRERLEVVADRIGSPTWARDVAQATTALIPVTEGQETLHLVGEGHTSWHGFASAIVMGSAQRGLAPLKPVDAITSAEFPTAARRPQRSNLSTARLQDRYGLRLPTWSGSLARCLDQIASESNMPRR